MTITIPDDLDARAAAEARRRGISKSELVRLGLAAVLPGPESGGTGDPWSDLAGFADPALRVEPGERRLREALAFDQDFAAAGVVEVTSKGG